MASFNVSPGALDNLVGESVPVADFPGQYTGVTIQASTTSGANVSTIVTSLTAIDTGFAGPGSTETETVSVAAVNDSDNSVTLSFGGDGQVETATMYVIGYAPGSVLLSSAPQVVDAIDLSTVPTAAVVGSILDVMSFAPIAQGTTLTFTDGAFSVQDQTNGQFTPTSGSPYTGPVAGLTNQLVLLTSDQVTVTASMPNVFVEVGVQGQPNPVIAGINVSQANGNNVLDSYANSSFLTDGTGTDQNYLDARGLAQNQWDTVANFHSGDNITLWGVTQADFNLDWIGDTQGATGFTGLTGVFVPNTANQPEAAVTLAGFKIADLTDGKLAITYDTIGGTPYASIHAA
jgi:hypothetical protein